MLKTLVVLATVCVCFAAAYQPTSVTADQDYLVKQKGIYELYHYVDHSANILPKLVQLANTYKIEEHLDSYTDQVAVKNFLKRYKHGMLPRGEIFSVFYPEHLEDAKALFEILYHTKDYQTFYNTAAWARYNVNEKLFIYCLTVAIIHRPDTKYIQIPPLYEIMPHYFFNNEIIQQVYHLKMGDLTGTKKNVVVKHLDGGRNQIVINSNYSGWYLTHGVQDEELLTYFTEDIGLNSFYFYFKHDFPFWMSSLDHHLTKDIRGDVYYFGHKQLLARYYLERLSNGLGEIEDIDWHSPIVPGYHPTLVHLNGLPFPHRPTEGLIPHYKYKYVQQVENIETFINMAIGTGYVLNDKGKNVDIYTPEGFNILANVIEGNADSINHKFYGSLDHVCKNILGFNLEPVNKYQITPSALEIFSTNLRDPAFYRIYKKILGYLLRYKSNLPVYTQKELLFSGVKIESVAVDKLTTYFDHFDSDISTAAPTLSKEDSVATSINVRQHRLNHKPFTYHLTINSDKNTKAMIRVFLGPKYDVHGHELDISENWLNFVELDQWIVDLNSGINKIERASYESQYLVPDDIPEIVAYNKISKAITSGEQHTYHKQVYGFPDRLVLPKGRKEGMPFKLFFFVSHLDEAKSVSMETPIFGPVVVDGHPMGYPLDRPVQPLNFNVPNMYFKDVLIYHKQTEELTV